MIPEQRAKELVPDVFGMPLSDDQKAFRERIAQAIRQAQNDKLEEAAQIADRVKFVADQHSSLIVESETAAASVAEAASAIAADIRSLKKD